jgi:cysteinyl-tRNA synthetase
MSKGSLGQPFDIHTGGIDLVFPHHENEIAQSTATTVDPMYANFFVHNAHLLIDNQKMSKSLNNFFTLEDISKKSFDPLAFRLLVLQAHYRKQAHFSWENIQAAQNRLRDLQAMAALRWQVLPTTSDTVTFALEDVPLELARFLADDLNTPQALAYLSDISAQLQAVMIETNMLDHFTNMLQGIDDLLGLNLLGVADISAEQKEFIARRESARVDKNWQQADEYRNRLTDEGISVRDTPNGPIWSRL